MSDNFDQQIQLDFKRFITNQSQRFAAGSIRMDLHCHDKNSDVPDELLGRILRSRETWLTTESLVARLSECGQQAFTITNHNNARSCYQLQDAGYDVLTGAEFTCNVPVFSNVAVHVLTYGFTPSQESKLNTLRSNLFKFLDYTRQKNIVTVLAHPLFFHDPDNQSTVELIELFTLLFENFEVVNGQRDARQAMLMAHYLMHLDEEKIDTLARKHQLNPRDYSDRPLKKGMTGGSDCHMGMFAGTCGTIFSAPGLEDEHSHLPLSELALRALKNGDVAPFADSVGGEKMTAAFLHFFCQLTIHLDDPGLLRLLLHKGTTRDKLLSFGVLNAIMELRRHKYTSRFLRAVHDALDGKKPGFVLRRVTSKPYRGLVGELDRLAEARSNDNLQFVRQIESTVPLMFDTLIRILSERMKTKLKNAEKNASVPANRLPAVHDIEVPAYVRTWFKSIAMSASDQSNHLDMASWTDGLSFPALAAACIVGAKFVSARVQHANRDFLDTFARTINAPTAPDKVMWISDTFYEKNGVSNSLKLFHDAAQNYQLPFTFAVSSHRNHTEEQLNEFEARFIVDVPFYRDQSLRLINVLDLEKSFLQNGTTHLMVSTEGPMGLCALYLKMAYAVPTYFYLHTDWLEYARLSLHFEPAALDRLRRMLRWFYSQFDGIFVLNSQHAEWLAGRDMEIPAEKIHITAHWCNPVFFPRPIDRSIVFSADHSGRTLLYAGRLSKEKGVLDLPHVYRAVAQHHPDVRLAIVGDGPEKETLQRELPDALFFDWVPKAVLANIYAASDICLFPSIFDTFGNSVLESLSSGTPVIAYNQKGPVNIIENGVSGFLVNSRNEMIDRACTLLNDMPLLQKMRLAARKRAGDFDRESIIQKMLNDMRIAAPGLQRDMSSPRSPGRKSA